MATKEKITILLLCIVLLAACRVKADASWKVNAKSKKEAKELTKALKDKVKVSYS